MKREKKNKSTEVVIAGLTRNPQKQGDSDFRQNDGIANQQISKSTITMKRPSLKTPNIVNRALLITAVLVVVLSSFGIQIVVRQIADDERKRVKIWASSVQQKAYLVGRSQTFFNEIQAMERSRVEFWTEALTNFVSLNHPDMYEFYRRVVEENTTIPFVVVDENRKFFDCRNTDFDCSKVEYFDDTLLQKFSKYPPIVNDVGGSEKYYTYYTNSKAFTDLEVMMNGLINSFIAEIVETSISAPVLLVTPDEKQVVNAGNIPREEYADSIVLKKTLDRMRQQNNPIEISDGFDTFLVFYRDSTILARLTYIPVIYFMLIITFIILTVWTFRVSRRSENNRLWAGMSRETAHQLGTPISSLIGWMEYLRINNQVSDESIVEMEKDIDRLKIISERFSKIGSEPKMTVENMVGVVYHSISYLQSRLSRKVKFTIKTPQDTVILAKINLQLVEWVLENLMRNAADAIGQKDGLIQIDVFEQNRAVVIDISDNGKGISKDKWKLIFEAGYTTKKRGWGLGLTLSQRIIHDYHKGRIFVKSSTLNEGTTFRIILNK